MYFERKKSRLIDAVERKIKTTEDWRKKRKGKEQTGKPWELGRMWAYGQGNQEMISTKERITW